MKLPGAKTARQVARMLQARILGGALILGYHRIDHAQTDSYDVCVSPENFAEHLEALRKFASPVSLSQLVQQLKEGPLLPNSVAVTFDDGYADNLFNARPMLEKYEIPATVFVCTGYAGREFWWDELARLVMDSSADLQALRLEVGNRRFQWDEPDLSPDAKGPEAVSLRRRFCHALYHFLLPMDLGELDLSMEKVRMWSRLAAREAPVPRGMSQEELLQLADGSLIEIGAHTAHHLLLPGLTLQRQREEIISSRQDLQALLGRPITGFAYPNGRSTAEVRRIVQEAGFDYACTSLHDVVRPGSDLYELTRFWQQDVDGDKFISTLNLWRKMR
jgi:peptidoglycan/xylan/chitin deacetylase (PgdA/CDA1 family)